SRVYPSKLLPLLARKEEQLAFPLDIRDGAPKVPSIVVEMKGRHGRVALRGRIGQFGARIFRIEDIVLDEFKASAVIFVSAASGDHVDGGGSRAPKLGVVVGSLHVHFLNEIDAHL